MPSSKRPPLTTSRVDANFAVSAGFRNPLQMTMWPRRTRHCHRRQRREGLEGNLVRRFGDGMEVIEDPLRLEAQRLGVPREFHCPRPGRGRVPSIELAFPTLRNE